MKSFICDLILWIQRIPIPIRKLFLRQLLSLLPSSFIAQLLGFILRKEKDLTLLFYCSREIQSFISDGLTTIKSSD